MCILLGEDYQSDELLSADLGEALVSTLLPQAAHKVEDCLTAQHPVADINTQHDGMFVVQDGSGVAWPDCQPRTGERCAWKTCDFTQEYLYLSKPNMESSQILVFTSLLVSCHILTPTYTTAAYGCCVLPKISIYEKATLQNVPINGSLS